MGETTIKGRVLVCNFFSFRTLKGKIYYFGYEQRKTEKDPDSHSRIAEVFFNLPINCDRSNTYEYVSGRQQDQPNQYTHSTHYVLLAPNWPKAGPRTSDLGHLGKQHDIRPSLLEFFLRELPADQVDIGPSLGPPVLVDGAKLG